MPSSGSTHWPAAATAALRSAMDVPVPAEAGCAQVQVCAAAVQRSADDGTAVPGACWANSAGGGRQPPGQSTATGTPSRQPTAALRPQVGQVSQVRRSPVLMPLPSGPRTLTAGTGDRWPRPTGGSPDVTVSTHAAAGQPRLGRVLTVVLTPQRHAGSLALTPHPTPGDVPPVHALLSARCRDGRGGEPPDRSCSTAC